MLVTRLLLRCCCSTTATTTTKRKMFALPDNLKGMKELDRDKFRKTVSIPCLRVPAKSISRILGLPSFKKYSLPKLAKIKAITPSLDSPDEKLILFNAQEPGQREEILAEVKSVLSTSTSSPPPLEFSTLTRELTYEDWDSKRCLRAVLPEGMEFSSYTQVGHIASLRLPDHLLPYKHTIAHILLDKVPTVRTVVNKQDMITNEYRFFEMELLAGEPNYIAEQSELGIRYRLDLSKVYWNSRLSNTHERMIGRMDERSVVFDAFCGVGPFVLPAVKSKRVYRCLANDLNPTAIHYLQENIKINKISPPDRISVYNLDAAEFIRRVIPEEIEKLASASPPPPPKMAFHVLMNLPATAISFLPLFQGLLSHLPQTRSFFEQHTFWVHCYAFAKAKEVKPPEWYPSEIRRLISEAIGGEGEMTIKELEFVRNVSNNKEMFCASMLLPPSCAYRNKKEEEAATERKSRARPATTPNGDGDGGEEKRQRVD